MAIFGRDRDEDYLEDEARKLNEKIPTRRFKDLNPQDRKKRREPIKPWGKKERTLVLTILLATVFTSAALALSARDWKLPGFPKISVPSFDFLSGETIVIEKGEHKQKDSEIISKFKDATKGLSGTYGLYVIRLNDGSSYGIDASETFQGASLLKLPLMAALYREVDRGNISLDTKYVLKNSDKVIGSGSLQAMPAGTVLTYRDLVVLMGKESDRTAFKIVKDILGDEKVNKVLSDVGMTKTSLVTGETAPYDVGIFFKKLWDRKIVSLKSRDEILGYLTDTIYENWIPAGIPKGVRIAHKYGRDVHVVNDAGIVFTKQPFVLVVMSQGVIEPEADSVFPNLAKIVYQGETSD